MTGYPGYRRAGNGPGIRYHHGAWASTKRTSAAGVLIVRFEMRIIQPDVETFAQEGHQVKES
ncbi:hypothetical protein AGR7A_pAt20137 [Agrobacterium deltaense NCPPB 1641]|uniref:Uncharacterized protein n=1 Tax=Agrobacterium deltaense NCPPB 1641 TaxID=1183425 RepID=A0A1S7U8L2_9HYPH|nr:hypothetical protein AGR7A_pAt20137 [Agrobacterium deltaense NCPPB 1641]